jgi:uncharacterized damage-inducible protein DinB
MSFKERLERNLVSARQVSERMLADFKTPEQWTRQVHATANHALWFAGHMATTDNFFISLLDPPKAAERPGFAEKFGTGSQPTNRPEDYPPPEEVLAYMRDRRRVLLEILEGMEEAELSKPTPKGAPGFLPDKASIFETAHWHEGLHSGQLSVVRRALGHAPLMNPGS